MIRKYGNTFANNLFAANMTYLISNKWEYSTPDFFYFKFRSSPRRHLHEWTSYGQQFKNCLSDDEKGFFF